MFSHVWIRHTAYKTVFESIGFFVSEILWHLYGVSQGQETLGYDAFYFLKMVLSHRYIYAFLILIAIYAFVFVCHILHDVWRRLED